MPKKRHSDTTRSLAPLRVDEALAAMLRTPLPPVMTASAREGLKRLQERKPTKKRAKKRKRR